MSIEAKHRSDEKFKRSVLKQFLLGVYVNINNIAPSMSLGFSAVALPALTDEKNEYFLTEDEGSWFASTASLATPFGCLLSGPLCDKYGRRGALQAMNLLSIIGWLIIGAAYYYPEHMYPLLLCGRVFTGMSTGIASVPGSLYLAEIASVKLIGVFTAWSSITFSLGILVVYVFGLFLKTYWGTIAFLSLIFPAVGIFITIFLIPESPTWLISKNRPEDALESVRRIWSSPELNEDIRQEVVRLQKNKASTQTSAQGPKSFKTKLFNKYKYFKQPTCWKPFLIVVAMFFFQQFSGVFSIVFYAIDISKSAGIVLGDYLTICLAALVRLITAICASMLSRKVGKRPLSMISGTGIMVTMLGLGIFISLKKQSQIDDSSLSDIPLVLLIGYFCLSSIGFLVVPFAMSAEVYPIKIRGLASAVSTCCGYLFNFLTVKTYPDMKKAMGIEGVFYLYGGVATVGTIFTIFLLPETRNKTIQDLEAHFSGNKKKQVALDRETV